jgi:hypothetical protein
VSATVTLAAVVQLVAAGSSGGNPVRRGGAPPAGHVVTHPSLDVATAVDLLDVSPPAVRAALEVGHPA